MLIGFEDPFLVMTLETEILYRPDLQHIRIRRFMGMVTLCAGPVLYGSVNPCIFFPQLLLRHLVMTHSTKPVLLLKERETDRGPGRTLGGLVTAVAHLHGIGRVLNPGDNRYGRVLGCFRPLFGCRRSLLFGPWFRRLPDTGLLCLRFLRVRRPGAIKRRHPVKKNGQKMVSGDRITAQAGKAEKKEEAQNDPPES